MNILDQLKELQLEQMAITAVRIKKMEELHDLEQRRAIVQDKINRLNTTRDQVDYDLYQASQEVVR